MAVHFKESQERHVFFVEVSPSKKIIALSVYAEGAVILTVY
jgi:hypothetical protein